MATFRTNSLDPCIQRNMIFQTNNPKYFAAGDAVNGGVEVVNAAAEAKRAAHGIDAYLHK